jgi:predicted nucleic acid-binding protein
VAVIVVDASVLVNVVGDDGPDGDQARMALAGQDVSVPDLADVEVVSVLRRRWLAKTLTARRFAAAIEDLAALPADRYPLLPFMRRAYDLRANVSAYDATYVALAEQLGCTLLTADARLAAAAGPRCPITVLDGHRSPRAG